MIDRAVLGDMIHEIEGYARGYGLDFFPVIFEMMDYEEINMVASYGGFPTRYPHWRFGMQYEYMQKSYGYGLHKIYEMVINNNPCYAYLLDSNQMVDQKLVIAHVFAHCDFFKNNAYFKNTNRRMMDELANHGNRIHDYMSQYGHDVVEDFIDVCSSIENLIDPGALFDSSGRARELAPTAESAPRDVARLRSKGYMEPFINPPEYLEARRREQSERDAVSTFPAQPVKDVLRFLIEYAPLPNWKRDILSMLREESYYFAPQAQTKIMNEGWASYWHEKIMTQKALEPSEIVDFADHHSSTLAVQPGQLNPYKLGYELYCDIERRWNTGRFGKDYEECDDAAARAAWNRGTGAGREKIFQVRAIYNDMTFVDEFLTEEFCRENRLFTYSLNERNGRYEIADREFRAVKEKLLFQLTNMGQPYITVVDANHENRGELYLKHRFDGVELRLDYAQATMEALFKIWTRPVHV
ncbi:MAG: SpoVR family protein, partial [Candidatus Krumholzibacteria bacterium]|nr:SpoVR family protein [Candidatus Krumholzibacteria bacterium]